MDSTDSAERLAQSHSELAKILQEKELKDASLLIFANKQVWQVDVELIFRTFVKLKLVLECISNPAPLVLAPRPPFNLHIHPASVWSPSL